MIVFDVDGTLIGGEATDWKSFDAAFEEVAGFSPPASFFENLEEVTAQAIVHQALAARPLEERKRKESEVRRAYLRNLQAAQAADPNCFPAIEGAAALLRELRRKDIPVAIATGDWRETILFKLSVAGLSVENIPLVTSSDFYSRADIIAEAVRRAGRELAEALYIGDGLWDYRACGKLGIPFVGVGSRSERLRRAGAQHILDNLSLAAVVTVWNELQKTQPSQA